MAEFSCIALCPAGYAHPGPAISAALAGGVGILDLDRCGDLRAAPLRHLDTLLRKTDPSHLIGLRLTTAQLAEAQPHLERLAHRPHVLILAGWRDLGAARAGRGLPGARPRLLWLEISAAAEVERTWGRRVDGLVL